MTHAELRAKIEALEDVQHRAKQSQFISDRLDRYRAQLAALGPEPEQPWTPRERRLREAIAGVQKILGTGKCRSGEHCAGCEYSGVEAVAILTAALADTPPPEPFQLRHAELRDDGGRLMVEVRDSATAKVYEGALPFTGMRTWEDEADSISDTPPPDARDEALERAEKALKYARNEMIGMANRAEGDEWLADVAARAEAKIDDALAFMELAKEKRNA